MNYSAQRRLVAEAFAQSHSSGSDDARCLCPLCLDRTGKADHRGSLSVHRETGFYRCFKCGAKGRLEGFGSEDTHVPVQPAKAPAPRLPRDFVPFTRKHANSFKLGVAARYLFDRVGSWDTIEAAGIGYAGNRIVVPVKTVEGDHFGHVARAIPNLRPSYLEDVKYVNSKGFRRESVLYNGAILFEETLDPAIVVEGAFDALPHWPFAVACFGKPADKQVELLRESKRPLLLVLDGDAWELGRSIAQRLSLDGHNVGWIRLPPGHDPAEIRIYTMREIIKHAAAHGIAGHGYELAA